MTINRIHGLVMTFLAGVALAGTQAQASARPSHLSPDNRPESIRERLDYADCRKKVLQRAKKTSGFSETQTKIGLAQCREEYPAASLFVECKKAALTKFARHADRLQAALATCRSRFELLNFSPGSPVPFYVTGGKAYFAGAGLNLARKVDLSLTRQADDDENGDNANDFGNFSCEVAENVLRGKQDEDYVLFGNHPNVFQGMGHVSDEDLRRRFKIKSGDIADDDYVNVAGDLRLFGSEKKGITVYFPLSYCYFNRRLGKIYQGIKVYYLLDKAKRNLVPYFGVAFYRQKGEKTLVKDLISKVRDAMGDEYKEVATHKGAIFIAKSPIKAFDPEGDPHNVCKEPRDNDFIAILKTDASETYADYLILSNVSNLCKYGDRIVGRLYAK